MMSYEEILASLSPKYAALARVALTEAFYTAPGGSTHHHNCKGGLAKHTLEVVNGCAAMCGPMIKRDILLTAAIWHDYNKTREYVLEADGKVSRTEFLYKFGHVATSAFLLRDKALEAGNFTEQEIDEMLHCILAHHGRFEWGSPSEPRTPEAWILHSNDMLSSRGLF